MRDAGRGRPIPCLVLNKKISFPEFPERFFKGVC
nr:MAG TPA: hypothetical protein [Caudoviricetes sp.]